MTLWNGFAEAIHAVPSISAAYAGAIALGAVVLANVAAALPALIAARTPTGVLLRAE